MIDAQPEQSMTRTRLIDDSARMIDACPFVRPGAGRAAVLFVSDLSGPMANQGLALNPYPSGSPPPMMVRKPIPKDRVAE